MIAEFFNSVILQYIQKSLSSSIDQITRMVSMFWFILFTTTDHPVYQL